MTEIAAWVGGCGHIPMRWTDPGTFPSGGVTLNRLLELTNLVDAAVFVFSEDDAIWYRGRDNPRPRDNVIFEYGLFLGKLGQGHVVIVKLGDPIQPTDLEGLNVITCPTENLDDAEPRFRHWIDGLDPLIHHNRTVAELATRRPSSGCCRSSAS